jgi:acetylglutamate kinase
MQSEKKSNLSIIKIGGNVIDNSHKLHEFLKAFSALEGYKILVHGGGKMATKLSEEIGLQAKLVDGRRITDIETLRVVTMVYAGLINKNLVAQLQMHHCNAIGLSGADGNIIKAKKRPIQKSSGKQETIDYGFVGDLDENSIHTQNLSILIENNFIPVFSAITHDGESQLLNTNADTIASALAVALSINYNTSLIYCFEKKGVLLDVNDEETRISQINATEFEKLKADNIIHSGMLPKLHNAFEAINKGVKEVFIGKAEELHLLKKQLFGTRITI